MGSRYVPREDAKVGRLGQVIELKKRRKEKIINRSNTTALKSIRKVSAVQEKQDMLQSARTKVPAFRWEQKMINQGSLCIGVGP